MSDYVAPLRDMQFVVEELIGLDDIQAIAEYGEVNADLVRQVFAEAGKFASEVLAPLDRIGDTHGSRWNANGVSTPSGFREAYRQFVDAGWNSLSGLSAFGGQGLPHIVSLPVGELWNSANLAFSLCPMLTAGVLEALERRGSDEQQKSYLPKLTSGEWSGTMNLTEPQAGSDLSAVRTRAQPQADGTYKLFGQKIFITYGEHDLAENIIHLVLARTPDAPEGTRGISLFIVPKYLVNADGSLGARNDVRCVSIEHKMGIHASPTCVLAYGDQGGATGYLVGAENEGLRTMFIMMNHARLAVGMQGVAVAERAYQHALTYARQRVQGRDIGVKSGDRVTIIHHPDVRRMLMVMKSQTEAMRAIAYTAAGALDLANRHPDKDKRADNQALVDLLTPIVKGWCTELAVEIASLGVQIHGGMGFIEETGAAQFYRDARITTIYEGTTGIQAMDLIGRKLGAENGATMNVVIAQMRRLASAIRADASAELAAPLAALDLAADALDEATKSVLSAYARDPREAAAVAVPFLKLSGVVIGGALLARSALIAAERLKADGPDAEFYRAKIVTANFYATHILPQCTAYAGTVMRGAPAALALAEAQF